MTTVQEASLDSPTIPGRPPILERSLSVPGFALRRVSEDLNESMPSATQISKSSVGSSLSSVMSHDSEDTSASKRSLSTRNLPPLIIPSKPNLPQNFEAKFPTSATHDIAVLPPQVPPKSPRTENRASPRKGPHPSPGNHALNQCTAFSPVVSSNGITSRAPLRPPRTPIRGESPPEILFPHSFDTKSPESFKTGAERLQSPLGLARPRFPTGINYEPNSSSDASPSTLQSHHQRWVSETSVTTHGRHEQKHNTMIYRSLSKSTMRNQSSHARHYELPSGFKVNDIMNRMSEKELKRLKQQAGLQVGNYEVLQSQDVKSLSKELRLLDERCEYLRRTYESLRQGRKSLHDRMISYLKTPSLASFSRETVLNQEEALAELDNSIDDWVKKLEQAENRRSRIRQKLLEHVAAALTLEFSGNSLTHQITNQQTPPESPTRCDDYYPNERRQVQSIKIYADSGVAALLAEIEQEIDFMDENSKF
ncbi:MAG: hypothetical protein Q9167_003155 [Letrouitia subvulpina]